MKFDEYEEIKIREIDFDRKKNVFESKIDYDFDGEKEMLCYSFEDEERQKEISSKLFDNVLKLYKFTKKKYVACCGQSETRVVRKEGKDRSVDQKSSCTTISPCKNFSMTESL